jgi:hypothetical protein
MGMIRFTHYNPDLLSKRRQHQWRRMTPESCQGNKGSEAHGSSRCAENKSAGMNLPKVNLPKVNLLE